MNTKLSTIWNVDEATFIVLRLMLHWGIEIIYVFTFILRVWTSFGIHTHAKTLNKYCIWMKILWQDIWTFQLMIYFKQLKCHKWFYPVYCDFISAVNAFSEHKCSILTEILTLWQIQSGVFCFIWHVSKEIIVWVLHKKAIYHAFCDENHAWKNTRW